MGSAFGARLEAICVLGSALLVNDLIWVVDTRTGMRANKKTATKAVPVNCFLCSVIATAIRILSYLQEAHSVMDTLGYITCGNRRSAVSKFKPSYLNLIIIATAKR